LVECHLACKKLALAIHATKVVRKKYGDMALYGVISRKNRLVKQKSELSKHLSF